MTTASEDVTGPLSVYKSMQEALLAGRGHEATLLPEHLLAEDLVVETPFSPAGTRGYQGRAAWLSYYRSSGAGLLVEFERFEELSTHHTDDSDVLVVEYELAGRVIATGVRASIRCIAVLRVRDGLIAHWREYQDIASITEALTRQAP